MKSDTSTETNHYEDDQKTTSWKEYPILALKGFLMGSADIVPGVSGGTMALILGIYERLINAIKSFDTGFFKNVFTFNFRSALQEVRWKFLIMLFTGIFFAILFFTKIVPLQVYMFTDPEIVYGLFFGLIVGSIFILLKAIDAYHWFNGLLILIGTGIGFWVVTLVPADTPDTIFFVFASGAIAICAMILPGISGSYLLLIMRKYDFILSQVSDLGTANTFNALLILLPFILGCMFGLALFSRFLSWLLKRYEAKTLAVLVGFLIGSLYVIWPYQHREYTEIITGRDVIAYESALANRLRSAPPEHRPEYQRLGAVINPYVELDELKKIELLSVKKKLLKNEPYIPYVTVKGPQTPHFWSGLWGMLIGLVMVVGLDYLRERKQF